MATSYYTKKAVWLKQLLANKATKLVRRGIYKSIPYCLCEPMRRRKTIKGKARRAILHKASGLTLAK